MSELEKKRIFYIDLLKAIAAFMVALYHFSEFGFFDFGYCADNKYIPGIGKVLLGLCCSSVPLFFLCNGLTSLNKPCLPRKLITKILNIFKIYFFWGIVISLLITNDSINLSFIRNILAHNLWYFWFFKTLALLYIYNFLCRYINFKIRCIIVSILIIFPLLTNYYWVVAKFFDNQAIVPAWGYTGFFTLYSIIFYELGRILSQKKFKYTVCLALILIGLFLNAFEVYVYSNANKHLLDNVNGLFPSICALMITIGLWQMCKRLCDGVKGNKFVTFIANNSLGIYMFHIPLIVFMRRCYNGTVNGVIGILITIMIVLSASVLSSLIKKSRIGTFLMKL